MDLVDGSNADKVEVEGIYRNAGNISPNETCRLAKEKAKLKALERVTGQIISSEELEKLVKFNGQTIIPGGLSSKHTDKRVL